MVVEASQDITVRELIELYNTIRELLEFYKKHGEQVILSLPDGEKYILTGQKEMDLIRDALSRYAAEES